MRTKTTILPQLNRTINKKVATLHPYSFNGMERDDEIKGAGNSLDFGARIYDARIGRWLSRDAYEFVFSHASPYNFAGNSPIWFYDPDGNILRIYYNDESGNPKYFDYKPGLEVPKSLNGELSKTVDALNIALIKGGIEILQLAYSEKYTVNIRLEARGVNKKSSPRFIHYDEEGDQGRKERDIFFSPDDAGFTTANYMPFFYDVFKITPDRLLFHEIVHAHNYFFGHKVLWISKLLFLRRKYIMSVDNGKDGYECWDNEEEKKTIERVNEVYTIQRYGHNGKNTLSEAPEPLSMKGPVNVDHLVVKTEKSKIKRAKKPKKNRNKTRPSF